MNSARRRKISVMLALLFLFLFAYTAHNTAYLRINTGFDCLEQSLYDSVQRFYSAQDNPRSLPYIIWQSVGPQARERSLYELFCWPFFLLFGVSYQTAIYPNFLFLLLLAFSVYKTGVLVKNREVGCLAAFLALMYPAVFGFARIYFSTIFATSIVSLGVYCFLSSGFFRSAGKTVLLTLCMFILVKLKMEKSLVYIFLPAVFYVLSDLRRNPGNGRLSGRQWRNIAAGTGIFFLLFLVSFRHGFTSGVMRYYLHDVKGFSSILRSGAASPGARAAVIYLKDLFSIQLGHLGSLLFIVSFPWFLKCRAGFKTFLICWIAVPYVFHSFYYYFSGIHSAYYTVQYLPAFALISACGIYGMLSSRGELLKRKVYAVIIAFSLLNYTLISHYGRQLPLLSRINSGSFTGKMSLSFIPGENIIFGTAQKLAEALAVTGGPARVVLANHYPSLHWLYGKMRLHNSIMRYRVSLYDYSFKVFSLEPPDKRPVLSERFRDADLVIDGNRMYPVESSERLRRYYQFGACYDFRGVMKNEEEEYNRRIGGMEKIYSVNTGKDRVDFWISREARRAFAAKTGRDICAVSRKEIRSLIRRPADKGTIADQKIKVVSSGGRNIVFWKGRELLSFNAMEDRNMPALTAQDVFVDAGERELVVSEKYGGGKFEQVWTIRMEGDMLDLKLEIDTRDQLRLQSPFVRFRRKASGPSRGRGEHGRKTAHSPDIVFGGLKQRFFERESSTNGSALSLNKEMFPPRRRHSVASLLGRHYDAHELSLLLHGAGGLYERKFPSRGIFTGQPALPGGTYFGIAPDVDLPGIIVISDPGLLASLHRMEEFRQDSENIVILANAGGAATLEPGRFTVLACRVFICGTDEDFTLDADKLRQDARPEYRLRKRRHLPSRHS